MLLSLTIALLATALLPAQAFVTIPLKAKRHVTNKRKRQAVMLRAEYADISFSGPLVIGNQLFEVIYDTGSTACSKDIPRYSPSSSSRLVSQDGFAIQYGDGSEASGSLMTDTVTLANSSVSLHLGACHDLSKQVLTSDAGDSGVLGLGFTLNSAVQPPSTAIWSALSLGASPAKIPAIFAMALRRNPDSSSIDEDGGVFVLGGFDSSLATGDITWLDIKSRAIGYQAVEWAVALDSVTVNGAQKSISAGSLAIIDSGTTLMYGPEQDLQAMFSGNPHVQQDETGVWYGDCDAISDLKISMRFGGVCVSAQRAANGFSDKRSDFPISPTDLRFPYANSDKGPQYCQVIQSYPQTQGMAPIWLLGATFMKNILAIFDATTSPPRIGMAARSESSYNGGLPSDGTREVPSSSQVAAAPTASGVRPHAGPSTSAADRLMAYSLFFSIQALAFMTLALL